MYGFQGLESQTRNTISLLSVLNMVPFWTDSLSCRLRMLFDALRDHVFLQCRSRSMIGQWALGTRCHDCQGRSGSRVLRLVGSNVKILESKMSPTDLIYLSMLVGAIPLGHLVKISGSPARKEFLCMVAGISLSLALVGRGILHSFVAVAGTYLIVILLGKR